MNKILKNHPNFRDIGGVRTKSGKEVLQNRLYRSGFLGDLEGEDLDQFKQLEIGKVIDLRTSDELELMGEGNYPEPTVHHNVPLNSGNITKLLIPIFEKGEFRLIEEGLLGKIYIDMVSIFSDELKQVYKVFLESEKPLIYHCSHGKDRTGLVSALFLELLEVERKEIYKDYLASNELRAKENAYQIQMIKDNFTKRFQREVTDQEFYPVEQLFVCQKEVLENVFNHIDQEFGSIEDYFKKSLEFTEQEIQEIRTKYTK